MATTNYIAKLNELAQRNHSDLKFEDVCSVGPDHIKTFTVRAVLDGKAYANGVGKNKKEAKQMAAKHALEAVISEPHQPSATAEEFPFRVPTLPVQPTVISQSKYMCWLNEYGQKNKVMIKAVEATSDQPNASQCCRFVVGDKEYPAAYAMTKKGAKEEAAKRVYLEMFGSETLQLKEDNKQVCGVSEVIPNSGVISTRGSAVVGAPLVAQAASPDVKPKIKLAANFPNADKNKEDLMPDLKELSTKKDAGPVEKPHQQSINSRFLSDYDSIDPLGKGAFGSVFKARQKLFDKYYAIKIIRCKDKALREVKALSALNHVNIVRYYTCWMEDTMHEWDSSTCSYSSSQSTCNPSDKFLYIEMELCYTKTLRVWIDEKNTQNVKKSRRDPRRREESLKIAQQLLSGVEYVHSQTLIHRDLKPANVLFGRDENVKIGDFGLVTAETDDEENAIERTVYKGTPSYMAPEQRNRKMYDRKVDIFALGLIYFELLWNLVTTQERQAIWDELRVQKFPERFVHYFQQESHIIKSMLSDQPQDRPEASQVKLQLEECAQILTMIKSMHSV